jgi:hypothetical protein
MPQPANDLYTTLHMTYSFLCRGCKQAGDGPLVSFLEACATPETADATADKANGGQQQST